MNPHCRPKHGRVNLDLLDPDAIDIGWSARVLFAQVILAKMLGAKMVHCSSMDLSWPWVHFRVEYE
ncbi:MAG: hypothetical protein ACR2QF_11280 [Geminicoccaceae bacterium]